MQHTIRAAIRSTELALADFFLKLLFRFATDTASILLNKGRFDRSFSSQGLLALLVCFIERENWFLCVKRVPGVVGADCDDSLSRVKDVVLVYSHSFSFHTLIELIVKCILILHQFEYTLVYIYEKRKYHVGSKRLVMVLTYFDYSWRKI